MTALDELVNETEIIFTATPEFDEHFDSIPQKAVPPPAQPDRNMEQIEGDAEHDKTAD